VLTCSPHDRIYAPVAPSGERPSRLWPRLGCGRARPPGALFDHQHTVRHVHAQTTPYRPGPAGVNSTAVWPKAGKSAETPQVGQDDP
jgi:hypothetical protein